MNNQCVETLSDHANVLTDVSYLNWSFTVLATEWFSFPALPSRYMWSSISKVLLSYSFIQLIFTVDFCVTFWMVLIHYFGAIMASFLARASPFKVAPYVLVTMFLSFFFNFLFWPNRMLQAHLVLTLPQPWNQQWFLLVGVVSETQDLVCPWYVWCTLIIFSLKIYPGHRPSGFHHPELEKHCSRITYSLVFWMCRSSSRWCLCSKSTAPRTLWKVMQSSGIVSGCSQWLELGSTLGSYWL